MQPEGSVSTRAHAYYNRIPIVTTSLTAVSCHSQANKFRLVDDMKSGIMIAESSSQVVFRCTLVISSPYSFYRWRFFNSMIPILLIGS